MQDREEISQDYFHYSRRSHLHHFDSSILKLMHKACVIAGNIIDPIDEFVIKCTGKRDFLKSHGLNVLCCVVGSNHEVKIWRKQHLIFMSILRVSADGLPKISSESKQSSFVSCEPFGNIDVGGARSKRFNHNITFILLSF